MTKLRVDGLSFEFPPEWTVSKFDDWSFYRNQFSRSLPGVKAVDLVAVGAEKKAGSTAWFVEVKDYREHARTKPSDLAEEVARKVVDTLAALLPAKTNANDAVENQIAESMLKAKRLRVVLHLEQPKKHSKLFPRAIDPADVKMKLKRLLKAIDPHPVVSEIGMMFNLEWSVE